MVTVFTTDDCREAKMRDNRRDDTYIGCCEECNAYPMCSVGQGMDPPKTMEAIESEIESILAEPEIIEQAIPDSQANRDYLAYMMRDLEGKLTEEDETQQ